MSDFTFLRLLRDPANVPDLIERDKIVRRIKRLRAQVVLDRDTIRHWNATHATARPISTAFEDVVIAFCDGTQPLEAAMAAHEAKRDEPS